VVLQRDFASAAVIEAADWAGVVQSNDLKLEGHSTAAIREACAGHDAPASLLLPPASFSRFHASQQPLARDFQVDQPSGTELPKRQRVVGPIHPVSDGPRGAANLCSELLEINVPVKKRLASWCHCRASL
jgi:hypothetical protein